MKIKPTIQNEYGFLFLTDDDGLRLEIGYGKKLLEIIFTTQKYVERSYGFWWFNERPKGLMLSFGLAYRFWGRA